MSIQALNFAFSTYGVGSSSKLLLLVLANYVGEDGTAWPSIETLARESELDKKTVLSKIKHLESSGYITVTRKHMKSNVYKLNMDISPSTKYVPCPKKDNESLSINIKNNKNKNNTIKDLSPKNGFDTENVPCQKVADLYNEIVASKTVLRAVKGLSSNRRGWIHARWKDNINRWAQAREVKSRAEHLDWWKRYFTKVYNSDFLSGRSREWTGCDFEWLIRPNNFVKVLEGRYDNERR